ncbi:MAG TPA: hypothetical protein VM282_21175 [Acidimicrobiales bacterium]|nr:hypothetical protein [Acidimicrobiales bacterium]
MRKMIVAAVAAASLSGGALVVAALAPIGIASAQDAGQTQSTPDATAEPTAKPKAQRRAAARARVQQRVMSRRGEIAEYLGLTPEALKQERQAGKSLAEIAGPKTEGLIDMLTAKAGARIDAALAAGSIDEARALTLKDRVATAIERLVNAKPPVATTAPPG